MRLKDIRVGEIFYFVDLDNYCVKMVVPVGIHRTVDKKYTVQVMEARIETDVWRRWVNPNKNEYNGLGQFTLNPKEIADFLFEKKEDAMGTLGFELMAERDLIEHCLKEIAEYGR